MRYGSVAAAPAIFKARRRVIRGCNRASRIGGPSEFVIYRLFALSTAIRVPDAKRFASIAIQIQEGRMRGKLDRGNARSSHRQRHTTCALARARLVSFLMVGF